VFGEGAEHCTRGACAPHLNGISIDMHKLIAVEQYETKIAQTLLGNETAGGCKLRLGRVTQQSQLVRLSDLSNRIVTGLPGEPPREGLCRSRHEFIV